MKEVKLNQYIIDSDEIFVKDVTTNVVLALFNQRTNLKGVYNIESNKFLDEKEREKLLIELSEFKNEYRFEGEDTIEDQIISALVIGGHYEENKKMDNKIVRIEHKIYPFAIEDFRIATNITPLKYDSKNKWSVKAIKDFKIIAKDNIIEIIKKVPEINKLKPHFYSIEEYIDYLKTKTHP